MPMDPTRIRSTWRGSRHVGRKGRRPRRRRGIDSGELIVADLPAGGPVRADYTCHDSPEPYLQRLPESERWDCACPCGIPTRSKPSCPEGLDLGRGAMKFPYSLPCISGPEVRYRCFETLDRSALEMLEGRTQLSVLRASPDQRVRWGPLPSKPSSGLYCAPWMITFGGAAYS